MEQQAIPLAEEAIRALGRLDVPTARTFVAEAFVVDQELGPFVDAVHLACAEIENDEGVSTATWNTLADAVDSPDLVAVVEQCRT